MKIVINATFYDLNDLEYERVYEYCNDAKHDYDYLEDPLDGSIQVFGMSEEHYIELKSILA